MKEKNKKKPEGDDLLIETPTVEEFQLKIDELEEKLKASLEANESVLTADEVKSIKKGEERALEQVASLKEDVETLEHLNSVLEDKIEELQTPINSLKPKEYNPDLDKGMDCREAEAAAREGKAFSRKDWKGAYMTYDAKNEVYIWNKPGCTPKPTELRDEHRAPTDFYLVVPK